MLHIMQKLMKNKTKIKILYKIKNTRQKILEIFFMNFKKIYCKILKYIKNNKLNYKKILIQEINFIKLLIRLVII